MFAYFIEEVEQMKHIGCKYQFLVMPPYKISLKCVFSSPEYIDLFCSGGIFSSQEQSS